MSSGKLIIFSGPSGVGKSTLANYLLDKMEVFEFSISATTRAPRVGEEHGVDYYYLSEDDFRRKQKAGEFIETEEVYDGLYYGTLRDEVDRIWKKGKHVLFDVDVKGGVRIKEQFPENTLAVLIKPPSINALRKRLIERGTEGDEMVEKRLQRVAEELNYESQFDAAVVNDVLEDSLEQLETLVTAFLR